MFLDPSLALFMLVFAGVFALEIGVFDLFGGDDEDDAGHGGNGYQSPGDDEEAPAAPGPAFDPAAYTERVEGTPGRDALVAATGDNAVAYLLGGGNDSLIGTEGNDYAAGGAGNDVITLLDGDDIIAGGDGDDTLRGGNGDDEIWGQEGDDILEGHGDDDILRGGAGNDRIEGGYGDDTIFGGAGNDTISTDTLTNPAEMGRGLDVVDGGAGDDNIFLGDGDEATGGEGADSFTVFEVASPDAPPARITDFDAATDSLHIQYIGRDDPDTGAPLDPGLALRYDADADETRVSIFGADIAALDGDAGLTVEAITLTRLP